ncbi:DUF2336 domain-containing protein [Bradyrhizobium iriomotense]|uniref:DUF2336 domain-containing protein n=1 Tax=Bradyrhizobium iriomotense TaxID=441950 RepID=A0ABQ6AZ44_9BRAD|nr:DUF2336 domain-containing protein [Bradyrhizobium iriomotense]GLR85157.1 hypothetical protein GCM10007857_18670 [Bradyrhizobium iriomotense]
MVETTSFLLDLEETVAKGNPESCLRAMWHATDLLIAGTYSEDQIWTFGEIIGRLAQEIETTSRARLAGKLASSNNAPYKLTSQLATDDCIDVAWPILKQSQRLDSETLIACARNKSQQHLLAISQRQSVPEAVTDVLVVRGGNEVVNSVAANNGASFSNSGFLHLVRRSEGDSILAESVGLRKDIPRHIFHQLIAKASAEVRQKLERERPDIGPQIHRVVVDVTGAVHARFGPASKDYFIAKRTVAKLHERGELTEDKVFEFAHSLKFNETAVALSLLCPLPVDVVERALIERDREPALILAKSLNYCWPTTMALLFLGAPNYRITAGELERLKLDFHRLDVKACRGVIAVYRSRRDEVGSGPFLRPRNAV